MEIPKEYKIKEKHIIKLNEFFDKVIKEEKKQEKNETRNK